VQLPLSYSKKALLQSTKLFPHALFVHSCKMKVSGIKPADHSIRKKLKNLQNWLDELVSLNYNNQALGTANALPHNSTCIRRGEDR
jgi:hypothetical protein